MQRHVIIVAAGSGTRMENTVPKQFMLLAGKPVVAHALERFYGFDNTINIILVLAESHVAQWQQLCANYNITLPHTIALGGPTRYHSVKSGLNAIKSTEGIVGVHDGARPLISPVVIAEAYVTAEKYGNAIPAITPPETVRELTLPGSRQLDRKNIRLIQTPQCFKLGALKQAYNTPYTDSFTDDASVTEAAGSHIHLIEGDRLNLKITTAADLLVAEVLLG